MKWYSICSYSVNRSLLFRGPSSEKSRQLMYILKDAHPLYVQYATEYLWETFQFFSRIEIPVFSGETWPGDSSIP